MESSTPFIMLISAQPKCPTGTGLVAGWLGSSGWCYYHFTTWEKFEGGGAASCWALLLFLLLLFSLSSSTAPYCCNISSGAHRVASLWLLMIVYIHILASFGLQMHKRLVLSNNGGVGVRSSMVRGFVDRGSPVCAVLL